MIRTSLFYLLALPATLFFSLVSLVGGLLGAPRRLHDWVHRRWSGLLLRTAGAELRVEGTANLDPEGGQVVVSNHQSLFDIPALFAALPVSLRFVAKRELGRIPVFAGAMRQAGHVFIDRSDPAGALADVREAGRRMREEGLTLGFFPEGTRSSDGRVRRFKGGSFVLALESGARIVPVAVAGGREVMRKGSLRVRPAPIRVRCGEAIPVEGLSVSDRGRLAGDSREAIRAMLAEMRDL